MKVEQIVKYNFPFDISTISITPQLYKKYLFIDLKNYDISIKKLEEKKYNYLFIGENNFIPNIFSYNGKKYFKVIEMNYFSGEYFCEAIESYNIINNDLNELLYIKPIYKQLPDIKNGATKVKNKLSIQNIKIKIKENENKDIILNSLNYNVPQGTMLFNKYNFFNIDKNWKEHLKESGFLNKSTYPDIDYFVYKNNYLDLYFNYENKYKILNINTGNKHNYNDKKIMYDLFFPEEYFYLDNYPQNTSLENSVIVGLKNYIFLNQIYINSIVINEAIVYNDLIEHIKLNNVYIITHIPITLYYKMIFFYLLGKFNMHYHTWKFIIDNKLPTGFMGIPVIIYI